MHSLEKNAPPRIILGEDSPVRVEVVPGLGGSLTRLQVRHPVSGKLIDVAQHNPALDLADLRKYRITRDALFGNMAVFFPCPPGRHLNCQIDSGGQPRAMLHVLEQAEGLHGVLPFGELGVIEGSIQPHSVSLLYDSRKHDGHYAGGHFTLRLDHQVSGPLLAHTFVIQNTDDREIDVGIATHPMLLKDPLGSGRAPWLKFSATGYLIPRGGVALPNGTVIPIPRNRDFSGYCEVPPELDECWAGFSGEAEIVYPSAHPGIDADLVVTQGADRAKYLQVWSLDQKIWAVEPHDIVPGGLHIQGLPSFKRIPTADKPVTAIRLAPGDTYRSRHWMKLDFQTTTGVYTPTVEE